MINTSSHPFPLSILRSRKEVIRLTEHGAFLAFSDHCRERADYYRSLFLKHHNVDFLDIEITLRRLSSKAIMAAQNAAAPSPGDVPDQQLADEIDRDIQDRLTRAGHGPGHDAQPALDDLRGPVERELYPHHQAAAENGQPCGCD